MKTNSNVVILEEPLQYREQVYVYNDEEWLVARLVELSKDFEVMSIPMKHLCIYSTVGSLSLRELARHFNAVLNADMDYPIILDQDGLIMDGRHRVAKALAYGLETIKAVRFEVNPVPCRRIPGDRHATIQTTL